MEKKNLPENSIFPNANTRRRRRIKFAKGRAFHTTWRFIRDDQNSQKLLTMERLFMKDEAFNFYTCSLSTLEDKQKLDWPSSCKPNIARIFCSCDGLVLILVSSGGYNEELVLWNPSTRESILLPHPEFPVRTCVCGLEYDATSEDYKILTINLNAADSFYTSIELLSLKSGSWRRIGYPTSIKPMPIVKCYYSTKAEDNVSKGKFRLAVFENIFPEPGSIGNSLSTSPCVSKVCMRTFYPP
ncbi:hypothetical protein KY289_035425 [Solanum tuberosum]|nr:hypothetical protein KY289_035425 [Solanum tuberosum]